MALNELIETFEFLKKRIERYGNDLRSGGGAETRTRQVLIDPLLRELGWDVSDPGLVELEFQIEKAYAGKGFDKADYVLKAGPRLLAVVEAKKLGSPLSDGVTFQASTYANNKNIDWMVVTDGDAWKMYEVFKRGELEDRVVMEFRISEDAASSCALRALALWNPNLCSEGGPVDAEAPVICRMEIPTSLGVALDKLGDVTGKKPVKAWFDGVEFEKIGSWVDVWVRTLNRLVDSGAPPRTLWQLRDGSTSMVVETQSQAGKAYEQLSNGLYARKGVPAKMLLKWCLMALEACGKKPGSVTVELR